MFFTSGPPWVGVLEYLSLVYVALPLLIFFLGWLNWYIAVPACVAMIFLLVKSAQKAIEEAPEGSQSITPAASRHLALAALAGTFLVACTGVGGFTYQFSDYWIYDAHLLQLIEYPWPMAGIFEVDGAPVEMPASMYWAYWLPAAVVGRIAGWAPAYLFQFLWNVVGFLLATAWFLRILGKAHFGFALMFMLFGGIDVIGYLVTAPLPDGNAVSWWDYLGGTYWWSTGPGWFAHWSANYALLTEAGKEATGGIFFRFYGPLWFLADGPHHVLPAWVVLMTVLHDALRRRTVERLYFLTSFLPLMSPFVTAGTVPLLALCTAHTRGRRIFTAGNAIFGPLLVVMFILYYSTVESSIPAGWLWQMQDIFRNLPLLLLYYFTAFLGYAILAPSMRGDGYRPGRMWFWTAIFVFLAAPWYRLGVFSDFTTKVIIPMQLVFLVCLGSALCRPTGAHARLRQRLTIAALCVGAVSPLGIVYRALDFGFSPYIPSRERVPYSYALFRSTSDSQIYFHKDNFFWRHLAAPVDYQYPPENEVVRDLDFGDPASVQPERWMVYGFNPTPVAGGLLLQQNGDMPLLRRDGIELDADRIGTAVLRHSIVDTQGNVPNYRIVLNWATSDEVAAGDPVWPYPRWHAHVLYPDPDPWKPLSTNPYWRGKVDSIALYLDVDGEPGASYSITLNDLKFFAR